MAKVQCITPCTHGKCVAFQKSLLWGAMDKKIQVAETVCEVDDHGIFQKLLLGHLPLKIAQG